MIAKSKYDPKASSSTSSSSTRLTSHQIPITSSVHLEFVVAPNMNDEFYSIPLEEAQPLNDSDENQTENTYLAEVTPGHYFGFRLVNRSPSSSSKLAIGCSVSIDNIPITSNNWWFLKLCDSYEEISEFERNDIGYPLQFSKSKILQDPSELKNSVRTDLSQVGKIELQFCKAKYSHTGPSKRKKKSQNHSKNQFEETIKIKEAQSKDKGVCAIGSNPIHRPFSKEKVDYFTLSDDIFKEVILLYRDPIGMISEKRKRNMLPQPSIRHSNITLELLEDEQPELKKVKRESTIIDLDRTVINLDDEEDHSNSTKPIEKRENSDEMKRTMTWNIHQVQEWLHSIDSSFVNSKVSKRFEEEEISGRVLFTLKEEDLKSLGCDTIGKRRLVLNEIEKLKNS